MEFTKKIEVDINDGITRNVKAKQGDTARYLEFILVDNGVPFSLRDKSIRVYALKPDGKEVYNDATITSDINGECSLNLTSQMLAVPGTLNLEIVITEGEDILSTSILEIDIEKTIASSEAIESTNEFTVLDNALSQVDAYNKEFEEKTGRIEELYTKRLNELSNKIDSIAINVKGYGAKGDGITDDTEAIQKAIDDIRGKKYRSILFPAGTYLISDTIYLRENTNYYGDGRSTVIKRANNKDNKPMLHLKEKETPIPPGLDLGAILGSKEAEKYLNVNIALQDLTLDGSRIDDDWESIDGADCLLLQGFFKCELNNVHVKNSKGNGYNFFSDRLSNTLRMINCFSINCNLYGIYTTGSCGDFHILLSDIGNSRLANIQYSAVSSTIKDSVIWNSIEDCGIVLDGEMLNITNNNIEGNARHQVLVWNTSHCMISGNKIYAGRYLGTAGIYCANNLNLSQNITMTGNNIISGITQGWPTFTKAVIIEENHKNFTFTGNSVKYLGNGVEDKSKRPYVEGLSIVNGDVWDNIGELCYIKGGFTRTDITPGVYNKINIKNIQYDLSNLVEDGSIRIREDGFYNLSGALTIGYAKLGNSLRVNLVVKKKNGSINKQTLYFSSDTASQKMIDFSTIQLLEYKDEVYLEVTSSRERDFIEENLEISYIVVSKS